jgi:hypothetical protein
MTPKIMEEYRSTVHYNFMKILVTLGVSYDIIFFESCG